MVIDHSFPDNALGRSRGSPQAFHGYVSGGGCRFPDTDSVPVGTPVLISVEDFFPGQRIRAVPVRSHSVYAAGRERFGTGSAKCLAPLVVFIKC